MRRAEGRGYSRPIRREACIGLVAAAAIAGCGSSSSHSSSAAPTRKFVRLTQTVDAGGGTSIRLMDARVVPSIAGLTPSEGDGWVIVDMTVTAGAGDSGGIVDGRMQILTTHSGLQQSSTDAEDKLPDRLWEADLRAGRPVKASAVYEVPLPQLKGAKLWVEGGTPQSVPLGF